MVIHSDKGLDDLRFAIIQQACKDYEASLKYLRNHPEHGWQSSKKIQMIRLREDCESFFKSKYFALLYDIDGEEVMRMIRKKFYNRPIRWGEERKKRKE